MTIRLLLVVALAAACSSTTTSSAGSMNEPVSVVAAKTPSGERVFIANASQNDLRIFNPAAQLFVRGPNAISPLSVDVGFRPARLAAGRTSTAADGLGFVLVAGSAPAVAIVDAQTLKPSVKSGEQCPAVAAASCLPAPAVDVAVSELGGVAFAALAKEGGGTARLARFAIEVEVGAPVLRLERLVPIPGRPAGLGALSDGSKVFVADAESARVIVVAADDSVTELTTAGPVADVVPSPAWVADDGVANHPEGEFLLALLSDGRLQTLNPASGGPAEDPVSPGAPIAPLSLGTPIRDLAFVPCVASGQTPCRTRLRLSSATALDLAGLGFAALGDGTGVALQPDQSFPQVYRPVLRSAGVAAVGTATITVPGESAPTTPLDIVEAATTTGFTRSETWTLTFQGPISGLASRAATLSGDGTALRLTDAGAFGAGRLAEGDTVTTTPLGSACAALSTALEWSVASVGADALVLNPVSGLDLAGCLPLRVTYVARAGGLRPWTVVGSASGFVGRAGMSLDAATSPLFETAGTRFFYPPVDAATGAIPPAGPALRFRIVGGDAQVRGTTISFATGSGLDPFIVGSEGLSNYGGGLANAVAALSDRIYLVQVATSHLVQVILGTIGESGAVSVFQ